MLTHQVDRGFYTNIRGPQFSGDVEADYSDIRKLQILTDKLRKLQHILSLNIRLGQQMKNSIKSIQNAQSLDTSNVANKINKFMYDQQTSSDRVSCLLLRSSGISQLVSPQSISTTSFLIHRRPGSEHPRNSSHRSRQRNEYRNAKTH